jgi:sugar lactone lactonase YvrE
VISWEESFHASHRTGAGVAQVATPRARRVLLLALALLCASLALSPSIARAFGPPFIQGFSSSTIATTQPTNLDENPYGIVSVPRSVGLLHRGDLLVSNFNASSNIQGTGSTIVQIPPGGNSQVAGTASLFAQIDPTNLPGPCPGAGTGVLGLTTALAVTRSGFVIVGALPTADGQLDQAGAGCLLVLNSDGQVVDTIAGGPINGPWDMTAVDYGFFTTLYVTNVENGPVATSSTPVDKGTVVRIDLLTIPGIKPFVLDERVIATRFPELASSTAVVLGPTGVALSRSGTLYVAETEDNRIAAIPDAPFRHTSAGAGITVTANGLLNAPLGMTLAPNGDILTANGNDGLVVETTPWGDQVASVDTGFGAGSLFGLTVTPGFDGVYLVNDGTNTLGVLGP